MSTSTEETAARKDTILVVDDNEHNRFLAATHLEREGHAILLAEDGEQAIGHFRDKRPDLVLLDVVMPGIDGFETCRRMRELDPRSEIPIVFLTAMNDLKSHQQAMASGADDFLSKPIQRTELLLRVRSLLRVSRISRELKASEATVREQNEALRLAQQQKADLTALVVHDLKTPLTGILGNAEFALMCDDPAEVQQVMREVILSGEQMQRMVMNLLDIAKSEDGQLVVREDTFKAEPLLRELAAAWRGRARTRGIDLRCTVAPNLRDIRADKDLVRRIVENLLDNSFKYAPQNGTIWVEASSSDAQIDLRVRDEGRGIPAEYKEKIFEKYVQLSEHMAVHARTSRGLGLVFCKLAAVALGGAIWVEDNQPKGSTFCLRLPAA